MKKSDVIPEKRCRIVVWNIAWRRLVSPAGAKIRARIDRLRPDVICVTEGHTDFFPRRGEMVAAVADYGYSPQPGRRKVMLWSRQPWSAVDRLGDRQMPTGRFVVGETQTPLGPVRMAGLCIPWSHAHVATGRRDRKIWQDHQTYLFGLEHFLGRESFEIPTILAGDFNQTIPRSRAPMPLYEQLIATLAPSFNVATAGQLAKFKKPPIDHLAATTELAAASIRPIPNLERSGKQLSDHIGLCIDMVRA